MAGLQKVKFCNLKTHKDKRGEIYYKGKVNKSLWLVIFPNLFKKEEDSPDFIAFLSEDIPREIDKDKEIRAEITE